MDQGPALELYSRPRRPWPLGTARRASVGAALWAQGPMAMQGWSHGEEGTCSSVALQCRTPSAAQGRVAFLRPDRRAPSPSAALPPTACLSCALLPDPCARASAPPEPLPPRRDLERGFFLLFCGISPENAWELRPRGIEQPRKRQSPSPLARFARAAVRCQYVRVCTRASEEPLRSRA